MFKYSITQKVFILVREARPSAVGPEQMPQIRRLWKDIGKAQEWKHPRAPSGKRLWKEKSTEAVLAFLRDTRVGCVRAERRLPEDAGVRTGSGDEGEEGGPGPPGL